MTSRPLLAKVDESIEIFGPMFHVGWFAACSGVIRSSSSSGLFLKGPPLAVMTSFSTFSLPQFRISSSIALCSLSTGMIFTPCFSAFLKRMSAVQLQSQCPRSLLRFWLVFLTRTATDRSVASLRMSAWRYHISRVPTTS